MSYTFDGSGVFTFLHFVGEGYGGWQTEAWYWRGTEGMVETGGLVHVVG